MERRGALRLTVVNQACEEMYLVIASLPASRHYTGLPYLQPPIARDVERRDNGSAHFSIE